MSQQEPYIAVELDEEYAVTNVLGAARMAPPEESEVTTLAEYRLVETSGGIKVFCRWDPVAGRCR